MVQLNKSQLDQLSQVSKTHPNRTMQKENTATESFQYVGPYRLQKTLGKGQTGTKDMDYNSPWANKLIFNIPSYFLHCRTREIGRPLCAREEGGNKNNQ